MIVGYYPFRAKGQVVRLLCEYLHLNYTDRFFDPDEWSKFKDNEGKDWVVSDLPFLKDADFVVTGPIAIATYLTLKAGRDDLFGRTAEDKLKVDSIHNRCDIGTAMIAAKTIARPACEIPNKQCQEYYWKSKIKPLLNIYEK
jgi:glutathione S-transferase